MSDDLMSALPEDEVAYRVEEKVRKRLFWEETENGPFEVRGQEHRRIVGAFAQHQTHSAKGSGSLSHTGKIPCGRQLSGCAVCARNFWLEDLYDMDLFTKPSDRKAENESAGQAADGEKESDGADHEDAAADSNGEGLDHDRGKPDDRITRRARFEVHPRCAAKVNKLLSAEVYARRWPNIPRHELWASSVQHPHVPNWRWLLHTRRTGKPRLDKNGQASLVQVCQDCGQHLSADKPEKVMSLKFALANDNWIGFTFYS